jgi:hypothetical protein
MVDIVLIPVVTLLTMAVEKVSVSLPAGVAHSARRAAECAGRSFLTWLGEKVVSATGRIQIRAYILIANMRAREVDEDPDVIYDPLTPEEMAEVDAVVEELKKGWTPEEKAWRRAVLAWMAGKGPHPDGLDPWWGTA